MKDMDKSEPKPRPGGRSARVQEAVHNAVIELQKNDDIELTIPNIAAKAGVMPSSIYRRWGNLNELLSDVALKRLLPEYVPEDKGSLKEDIRAWFLQYYEDMTAPFGKSLLLDIIGGVKSGNACQCLVNLSHQLEIIIERAMLRGESAPNINVIIDTLVSPLIYRILFSDNTPSFESFEEKIDELLGF